MMPKLNGFEVCRKIRSESGVPVIMLTARDQDEDVIRGLDLGADDYVVKPFSHKQLMARIRTALRRAGTRQVAKESDQVTAGDMVLDVDAHEVVRGGQRIRLTPLEFRLLYCLATNAGRLVGTAKLIEYVWGYKDGGDANLLKTHICHIRRKLGMQPGKRGYIKNVPGTGYAIF
jgi:two-component system response regulator MtrA